MGSKVNYISPSMLFHMYGFEPNTYDITNLPSNTLKNLNFLPLSCILNYFYVYSYETILNVPKDNKGQQCNNLKYLYFKK